MAFIFGLVLSGLGGWFLGCDGKIYKWVAYICGFFAGILIGMPA